MGRGGGPDQATSALLYGPRTASRSDDEHQERLARKLADLAFRATNDWRNAAGELFDMIAYGQVDRDTPGIDRTFESLARRIELGTPSAVSEVSAELQRMMFDDAIKPQTLFTGLPVEAMAALSAGPIGKTVGTNMIDFAFNREYFNQMNVMLSERDVLARGLAAALAVPGATERDPVRKALYRTASEMIHSYVSPQSKRERFMFNLVRGLDTRIVYYSGGGTELLHLRASVTDQTTRCGKKSVIGSPRWVAGYNGQWHDTVEGNGGHFRTCQRCKSSVSRDRVAGGTEPYEGRRRLDQSEQDQLTADCAAVLQTMLQSGSEESRSFDYLNDAVMDHAREQTTTYAVDELLKLDPEERIRRLVTPARFKLMKDSGKPLPTLGKGELTELVHPHHYKLTQPGGERSGRHAIAEKISKRYGLGSSPL